MVNALKYAGSTYVKLDDLIDKPPLRERIAFVKEETGKFGERLVATFESGRKLSLNATSAGALMRDIGQETDSWTGHDVEIYAGEITFQGRKTDAVLVRPAKSKKAAAKPAGGGSMDDEIPFAPEWR